MFVLLSIFLVINAVSVQNFIIPGMTSFSERESETTIIESPMGYQKITEVEESENIVNSGGGLLGMQSGMSGMSGLQSQTEALTDYAMNDILSEVQDIENDVNLVQSLPQNYMGSNGFMGGLQNLENMKLNMMRNGISGVGNGISSFANSIYDTSSMYGGGMSPFSNIPFMSGLSPFTNMFRPGQGIMPYSPGSSFPYMNGLNSLIQPYMNNLPGMGYMNNLPGMGYLNGLSNMGMSSSGLPYYPSGMNSLIGGSGISGIPYSPMNYLSQMMGGMYPSNMPYIPGIGNIPGMGYLPGMGNSCYSPFINTFPDYINGNSYFSEIDRAWFLEQYSSLSPQQLNMMGGLFEMFQSESLPSMFMNYGNNINDMQEIYRLITLMLQEMYGPNGEILFNPCMMPQYQARIMEIIMLLGNNCPICECLMYCMQNDPSLIPFALSLTETIIERAQIGMVM